MYTWNYMKDAGLKVITEDGLGYIIEAIKTSPQIKSMAICNPRFHYLGVELMKTQDISQCLLALQSRGQYLEVLFGKFSSYYCVQYSQ